MKTEKHTIACFTRILHFNIFKKIACVEEKYVKRDKDQRKFSRVITFGRAKLNITFSAELSLSHGIPEEVKKRGY